MTEKNMTEINSTAEGTKKKVFVSKLVLLGDVFVGKTSIATRYLKI